MRDLYKIDVLNDDEKRAREIALSDLRNKSKPDYEIERMQSLSKDLEVTKSHVQDSLNRYSLDQNEVLE